MFNEEARNRDPRSLLGLVVGDAVGTTLEFRASGSFERTHEPSLYTVFHQR